MSKLVFFDRQQLDDPYPRYAYWREQHPIWRDRDSGMWVLSRQQDVFDVLRDHTRFSSSAMGGMLPLISDDPPRHTQLRGLVNRAFTTGMLKRMTPAIEDVANRLVDEMRDHDVDAVTSLTTPLPVIVISRLMGIPEERRDDFKRWSDALTGTLAGALPTERRADVMEMSAFFHGLIGERRSHPGEDLVSAIVNAEIDGQRLSDNEIVGFNILLLIAGNETTTNLLGNLLNVLVDRPDLWSQLRNDPALIETAIEETLRFDSPVQFLMREATEDLELHGQRVRKGERVMVVMGSANRDPSVHPEPDTFSLVRERARHHAFGYGIHFCIGAPLARLEARVAVQALVDRARTLTRGEGHAERVPSHLLRGFHHLPVRLTRV